MKTSTFLRRAMIALAAGATLAWLSGCVRLTSPDWTYTRLGSSKATSIQVKLGTNSITLRGYASDGEALAGAVAEGVAKGLK